jgi:ATP-binding cassette subfamily B protein
VQERILDVAANVELDAYEQPEFFDALQRAQMSGQVRPWQMTVGLFAVVTAGVSVIGIALALPLGLHVLLDNALAAAKRLVIAVVRMFVGGDVRADQPEFVVADPCVRFLY